MTIVRFAIGAIAIIAAASSAQAQVIGTFRWQTEPFCNVVTLTVTQTGGVFTLDGFDDQCGAATRAAASGTAVPNPDGSIALGLTIVSAPEASPLHLTVPVNLATLSGTWRDSAGQSGPFRFTPGPGSGGARRPSTGTLGPVVLPTTPDGALNLNNPRGIVSREPEGGALLWLAAKRALRAGLVEGAQWDDANVGPQSVAFGLNTVASGPRSMAAGHATIASGSSSIAAGTGSIASGQSSVALGQDVTAGGFGAVALGQRTVASGGVSLAAGLDSVASGSRSLAVGEFARAAGFAAVALGSFTAANGSSSVALGRRAVANADGSFVFGDRSTERDVESGIPNQFLVRAAGGTVFWSTGNTTFGSGPGVALFPGASAWAAAGPAAARENAHDLDGEGVLGKIALMPVRTWNYKAQPASIRHAGPTAEDFHAAFGLGDDPRYISTTDADGIGFAAIQALEARTRELSQTNEVLRRDNDTLRLMLTALVDRLARVERLATERLTVNERR